MIVSDGFQSWFKVTMSWLSSNPFTSTFRGKASFLLPPGVQRKYSDSKKFRPCSNNVTWWPWLSFSVKPEASTSFSVPRKTSFA